MQSILMHTEPSLKQNRQLIPFGIDDDVCNNRLCVAFFFFRIKVSMKPYKKQAAKRLSYRLVLGLRALLPKQRIPSTLKMPMKIHDLIVKSTRKPDTKPKIFYQCPYVIMREM